MIIANPTSAMAEKVITSRHIVTRKITRFQLAKWYAEIAPNIKRIAPTIMITKISQSFIIYSLFWHSAKRMAHSVFFRFALSAMRSAGQVLRPSIYLVYAGTKLYRHQSVLLFTSNLDSALGSFTKNCCSFSQAYSSQ